MKFTSGAECGKSCESIAGLGLRPGFPSPKGRIECSSTVAGAVLVGYSDKDEGADKRNVQDNSEEGRQSAAGETTEQQQAGEGVDDGDAGYALNSLYFGADGQFVVGEGGEDVRVDGENEGGTGELHAADKPLDELEADGCAHGGGGEGDVVPMQVSWLDGWMQVVPRTDGSGGYSEESGR